MKFNKKVSASLAAGAVTLAGAGVAYAYFTTTSTGSGSAAVGSSSALTFTGAATATDLYPGGTARPIAFSVDNTSDGHQYLGTMTATVVAVYDSTDSFKIDETGSGPNQGLCDTTNFGTADAANPVGDIAGGTTYDSSSDPTTEPTVSMNNDNGTASPVDQDHCQGAVVHLSLSSS